MAVNLLALANQMRGNLHSSPSGSRTRSSDANEPGNLPSGSHIPGTDIKQDAGIRSVARKGRKGDTELRRVGGEVAHVNTTEANAIDALGPMGEAWVQSIGSGTRNPQTGRPEYWPKFLTPPKSVREGVQSGLDWIQEEVPGAQTIADSWDDTTSAIKTTTSQTWKPSEGKWGVFGQTDASKERDKAKAESAVRSDMFEKFRRGYEGENIAGIFTENTEDDTDLLKDYTGGLPGFEKFVTEQSGLNHPTGTVTSNDIADYLDPYDTRKEDEIDATLTRDLDKAKIATKALVAQQQDTGNQLSSGMFGMLTQSNEKSAVQGFAGAGDFAADFEKQQTIKNAESQFGGIDRANEELGIDIAQTVADAASSTLDEQENYNQEFWENMIGWESAISS
jgi:hypothetical protein